MAGEVEFEVEEWMSFLNSVDRSVKNPHKILRAAFSTRGFHDVIDHFQSEKGPGDPWAPLKYRVGKALQDTGNLRRNFLPSNVNDRGRNSIVFFNPTPYSGAHDNGVPSRNIPKREFMWLSDNAQEDMLNIILDQVVK